MEGSRSQCYVTFWRAVAFYFSPSINTERNHLFALSSRSPSPAFPFALVNLKLPFCNTSHFLNRSRMKKVNVKVPCFIYFFLIC